MMGTGENDTGASWKELPQVKLETTGTSKLTMTVIDYNPLTL